MRLRLEPPEIPEDGFSGIDIFQRQKFADGLLSLANAVTDNFVLLLDAPWGSGKTFFLKQFRKRAELNGFPTLYLDAFRHDLTGDAFAALSGEILAYLDAFKSERSQARQKFLRSAARVGKVALKGAIGAGAAAATAGMLNARTFEGLVSSHDASSELAKELSEAIEGAAETAMEEILNKQAAAAASLKTMREALRAACEEMLKHNNSEAKNNVQNRVFFLVDELDRCRPSFALDMIECIKHFFDSERVVFVLSADSRQLLNSISHVYGQSIDARTYFEKFYDLRIALPEAVEGGRVLPVYARYAKQFLPDDMEGSRYTESAVDVLVELAELYGLSLRTFEKIMQRFVVVLAQSDKDSARFVPAITILCFAAVVDPEFYNLLRFGKCTLSDYLSRFSLLHGANESSSASWIRSFFEYVLREDGTPSQDEGWKSTFFRYSFGRSTNILPIIAERFVEPISVVG